MDWFTLAEITADPIKALLSDRFLSQASNSSEVRQRIDIRKIVSHEKERRQIERALGEITDEVVSAIDQSLSQYGSEQASEVEQLCKLVRGFFEFHCDLNLILDKSYDADAIFTAAAEPYLKKCGERLSDSQLINLQRALRDALQVLISAMMQLPVFDAQRRAWSVETLNDLAASMAQLKSMVMSISQASSSPSEKDFEGTERRYRAALARSVDSLDLLGVDIPAYLRRSPLQVGYTSVSLSDQAGGDDEAYPSVEGLFERFLDSSNYVLLIRGDAGSGKTTICRWLALQLALGQKIVSAGKSDRFGTPYRKFDPDPRWANLVPLLVSLRDCQGIPELEDLASGVPGFRAGAQWVEELLKLRRAILILDGIDETEREGRDTLALWIAQLRDKYPYLKVIITSRPTAIERPWTRLGQYWDVTVNSLNAAQQEALVALWFISARQQLFKMGLEWRNLSAVEASLRREMNRTKALSRLAVNPLLCAAICALAVQRGGIVPDNAREVCAALIEALLHRRQSEKDVGNPTARGAKALSLQHKLIVFQDLAQGMMSRGQSAMATQDAVQVLISSSGNQLKQPLDLALAEDLLESSGLTRESRPGQLEFCHNAIKELLAADAFVEKDQVPALLNHIGDADWYPVLRFAASSRQLTATNLVVDALLKAVRTAKGRDRRSLSYLALTAAAGAPRIRGDTWNTIFTLALDMLPPANFEEAEAVSVAGDTVAKKLAWNKRQSAEVAAASIRTLALIGTDVASEILLSYVHDTRPAVRRELMESINPLLIPEYRRLALSANGLPREIGIRVCDLRPLVKEKTAAILNLSGSALSSLDGLEQLSSLTTVKIGNTRVVDLEPLKTCRKIECLDLSFTFVESIEPLRYLVNLRQLDLDYTRIESAEAINALPKLELISMRRVPAASTFKPRGNQTLYVD